MNKLLSKIFYTLLGLVLVSCGTGRQSRHLTESLFLNRDRITVTHPGGDKSGHMVLGEQVNYTMVAEGGKTEDTSSGSESSKLDTAQVYTLPQVVVTSLTRFTPVREGSVTLDFVINVPASFINDDYQLVLTPELLHNDSLVRLDEVVLRGKNFVKMQEENYNRYDEYLAGLIDSTAYDTAFVNRKALEDELKRRRKLGINDYYTEWNNVKEYEQWRYNKEIEFSRYNAIQDLKLNQELKKEYLAYDVKLKRLLATGKDTVKLNRAYRRKVESMRRKAPAARQITFAVIPAKYRRYYVENVTSEDVQPTLPEYQDSLKLAGNFLQEELIAMNELEKSRRDEVFKQMVPYPYLPDAHYSLTVPGGRAFTYRYTHSYPVTPDLKYLRLSLDGRIAATDLSTYSARKTDTLNYIISSLDELADTRLLSKGDFTESERAEYSRALRLLQGREYTRALTILNNFKDYNTALTLTCLGYNEQAFSLAKQLPKNANVHYLLTILNCRLKDEQEAIKQLKEAVRKDESKLFRIERDPEVSNLVRRYGLMPELENLY